MDLQSLEEKLAAFAPPSSDPPAPSTSSSSSTHLAPAPTAERSKRRPKKKKQVKQTLPQQQQKQQQQTSTTSSRFDKLYQQGKKQLAKQEQRRKTKPTGCTFNPKTNADRRQRQGSKAKTSQSRFDRLYENAKKTKAKLDQERKTKKDHPDGCTFNPKTNMDRNAGGSARRRSAGSGNPTGTTRDARFNRLYEDAAKTRAKIANARQRRADAAGTFKPKITKKAQRSASPSPQARFNKLYRDGQRDLDSQRAKQRADRELEGCTFSPSINKRSSTRSSSSRRSRESGDNSFADRLLEYGRRAEERLDRKRMEANSVRDKEATFQPNTKRSKGSRGRHSTGGRYSQYSTEESVEEAAKRLSQVETKEQYEKRLERRRQELAVQNGATFRPRVNKRSSSSSSRRQRPASARRSRGEGGASIWERLNTESKELNDRQASWKKEREKRELAACTFKPKIHSKPISKQSSAASTSTSSGKRPVWERLSNVNIGREHMLRDEMKKKKELKECTFQPRLTHHRRKGTSPATTPSKVPIWERLNKETKNVALLEKKKTEYELKGCTFSPSLSKETAEMTQFAPPDAKPVWERLFEEATDERKVS